MLHFHILIWSPCSYNILMSLLTLNLLLKSRDLSLSVRMWSPLLDTAKRGMVLGWRKTHQHRPQKTVLHHHILREMILHLLCTTFLIDWMDSTPSLVRVLIPWTAALMLMIHGLQEWILASLSLRRIWVIFVNALTFHHHPHRFSLLLLYFNLKPCIWLCFYDIILWTFGIFFSICYVVNYDWTW